MYIPTRTLGKGGPKVTGLGLCLMSLGSAYGLAGSDSEHLAFLDKAYELGARKWDCADIYGDIEELRGKWFKRTGKKDDVRSILIEIWLFGRFC
jgi:aryl-alcohol dehydrogenase-like predicted oxidoreductase